MTRVRRRRSAGVALGAGLGAGTTALTYVAPLVTSVPFPTALAASAIQVHCGAPTVSFPAAAYLRDASGQQIDRVRVRIAAVGVPSTACAAVLPIALPPRLYVQAGQGPLPAANTAPASDLLGVFPCTELADGTNVSALVVPWPDQNAPADWPLTGASPFGLGGSEVFAIFHVGAFPRGAWYRLTVVSYYQMPVSGASGEQWVSIQRFAS